MALIFSLTGQALAASTDLSLRVETPKSPTRENSFKIGFVVLDIVNRPVTVKCLKKGPSDAAFTQFGADFNFAAGGNSGDCEVTSSIVSAKGTYEFKVSAAAGSDFVESPVMSVSYSSDFPSTPVSYSKEQPSSCDYKIKFKTADDGRTTKVRIYRSTETSFTADSSTEVGTVNIGPNQEGTSTNTVPDCSKNYFFAIRAFDDFGNGSGITGDFQVTVVTKTVTTQASPSTTLEGAIPVSVSQVGQGEILGEATGEGKEKEENILGESTPAAEISPAPSSGRPLGNLFSVRNLIIGGLLILVLYFLYRRLRLSK